MTRDEIIEMARHAGMYQDLNVSWNQSIQNFAKLVAAKERERLAQEARECGGVLTVGAILAKGEA